MSRRRLVYSFLSVVFVLFLSTPVFGAGFALYEGSARGNVLGAGSWPRPTTRQPCSTTRPASPSSRAPRSSSVSRRSRPVHVDVSTGTAPGELRFPDQLVFPAPRLPDLPDQRQLVCGAGDLLTLWPRDGVPERLAGPLQQLPGLDPGSRDQPEHRLEDQRQVFRRGRRGCLVLQRDAAKGIQYHRSGYRGYGFQG